MNMSRLFVSCETGRPVGLQTAHLNSSYLNLLVKDQHQCKCPMCCWRNWQRGKWHNSGTAQAEREHSYVQQLWEWISRSKVSLADIWVCAHWCVWERESEKKGGRLCVMPLLMGSIQKTTRFHSSSLFSLFPLHILLSVTLWGHHNLKSRPTVLIQGHCFFI